MQKSPLWITMGALGLLSLLLSCDSTRVNVVGPDGGEDPAVGTVQGTVTVAGSALSGVTLQLDGSSSATTDASGSYSFASVSTGSHTVSIDGYASDVSFPETSQSVSISTNGQTVTADFPGSYIRTSSISGTVSAGGTGIANAAVSLTGTHESSTTTAGDGTYGFSELRAGPYTVTISGWDSEASSFATTSQSVSVAVGETRTVDFAGTVVSTTTGAIQGTVSTDGGGLAGVTVNLTGTASGTTTTADNGTYRFESLDPGEYTVTISSFGAATFSETSKSVSVSAQTTETVDFAGSGGGGTGTIEGTISVGLTLISDMTVTLGGGGSGTATTGSNGAYSFSGLQAGSYTVTISGWDTNAYDFSIVVQAVDLSAGETETVHFNGFTVAVGIPRVDVDPAGASVSGLGTRTTFTARAYSASGQEVPGASIVWASLNTEVVTINASTGEATSVSSGQATISATAAGEVVGYAVITVAATASPVTRWSGGDAGVSYDIFAVHGQSGEDIFIAGGLSGGYTVPKRYDGSAWQLFDEMDSYEENLRNTLRTAWTAPEAGQDYTIWMFGDGGQMAKYSPCCSAIGGTGTGESMLGSWIASPADIFVVGSAGTVRHATSFDLGDWSPMGSAVSNDLNDAWGTSSDDIHAIGDQGVIVHYDGTFWSRVTSPTSVDLHALWGSSNQDVFAVGQGGTVLRFDGSTWVDISPGLTSNTLFGVWGTSPSDLYVVGQGGVILRFDGSSWTVMSSGTIQNLHGIWGSTGSDFIAVGASGTILWGRR